MPRGTATRRTGCVPTVFSIHDSEPDEEHPGQKAVQQSRQRPTLAPRWPNFLLTPLSLSVIHFPSQLLRRHSAALVHHPLPELPNPPFESTCDDTAYVRLHGMRAEHEWDFTDEELRPYVDKVGRGRSR